ncbi:unnamed protein product [Citrullus colocynthis]|uniref:Uncharacterized protein n=1 Tax=Citrullus colocynthis TaxID=252529 RepID=A0ABP0Y6Y8_9ROSI
MDHWTLLTNDDAFPAFSSRLRHLTRHFSEYGPVSEVCVACMFFLAYNLRFDFSPLVLRSSSPDSHLFLLF